jgi:hypothetical protein
LTHGTQRLKPDLVIVKLGVAYIVDVTVAYDHPSVFNRAAEEKVRKYGVLTPEDMPSDLGEISRLEVVPVVLGARGGWRSSNSKINKILGISHSFAKINIIRTIKASLLMLRLHSSLQTSRNGNFGNNALTLTSRSALRRRNLVVCNNQLNVCSSSVGVVNADVLTYAVTAPGQSR